MAAKSVSELAAPAVTPRKERLLSLDVFRGLTLFGMVLANTHGDPRFRYPPLSHAAWHGWTFTDLIFPFFLFIVGVAIPYSIESQRSRGGTSGQIVRKAFRRAVVLFLIGVAMNWYHTLNVAKPAFDWPHLRFFNVLQRIAICSVVLTVLYLWVKPRTQAALAVMILVLYFVLMKYVPVPGYGAGVLDKVGNWAQYVDEQVMGPHCGSMAQGHYFEGKGLLSTLPALVTALLGLWTGRYLRSSATALEKLVNLYFCGTAAMFLGAVWDYFIPINQNLWTSSLVLLMGGMAMVVLASCYYVADVRKITWWTKPFVIFGMNSIAVWVGSVTLRDTLEKIQVAGNSGKLISLKTYLNDALVPWLGPMNASLGFAILFTLFWLAVLGVCYRYKIVFKV